MTSTVLPVEAIEVLPQLGPHLHRGAGVQGGERLVEQQQLGAGGESADQRDPLGLPAGQRPGPARRLGGQPDRLQPARGLRPGDAAGPSPRARRPNATFSSARQVVEQQVVLEDHADRAFARRAGTASAVRPRRRRPGGSARRSSGSSPASARSAVVLPAPLGPSSATTSPGATVELERRGRTPTDERPAARRTASPAIIGSPLIQRSRRQARTTTETASRTRLSTMATSGSVSSARYTASGIVRGAARAGSRRR